MKGLNLTFELGFRYDANFTPTEALNRFVVFDPATASLVQVGSAGFGQAFHTNNKNFQPRLGIAWDPFGDGKTSVRAGYAILTDQPVTNAVTGLSANPPFGDPLSVNNAQQPSLSLTNAFSVASGPAGIAPFTIFAGFDNPYVQSWNLTIQREITPSLGVQLGYIGSKGTHLRLARNLNQPTIGQPIPALSGTTEQTPFTALSSSSPIDPGKALNNISEVDSSGNSNYNALWLSVNKRFARGLQFNASYTYSKSLDYNSLSSQGVVLEDSTNPRLNYGPSDFDARNRFVVNLIYGLPFKGNRLFSGWEIATISQAQSGNPLTLLVPVSGPTGNFTLRPDVSGPIQISGNPAQWFPNGSAVLSAPGVESGTTTPCPAIPPRGVSCTYHFGSLGRNSVIGPDFINTDFSVIKNTKLTERFNLQFRTEVFDIFNHPNFGNPGLFIGTGTFGKIFSTRFPPGDFGSSRQIQLALKLQF